MTLSKQLVYTKYSVCRSWLGCGLQHMNTIKLPTLSDGVNQSPSLPSDTIVLTAVPRSTCFRAAFSTVFAHLFPCRGRGRWERGVEVEVCQKSEGNVCCKLSHC